MNNSSGARRFSRLFATLSAAAVLTSVFAAPAFADPDPTPTSTAPASSEAPTSSAAAPSSAPPSSESSPSATAKPKAERVRVEASVAFEKKDEPYRSDEDIRFTLTIKNPTETKAVGLTVFQFLDRPTDLSVQYEPGWGPLTSGRGLDLDPGATYEITVVGKVRDFEQTSATVRGVLFDGAGWGASAEFGAEAKVVKAPGHATGLVFGDKNGNGVYDRGEELAGASITLRYVHANGGGTYTATTDKNGKFSIDLPAADYYIGGSVVQGWLIPWETVHIGPETNLLVRGAPPLNGALRASIAFTQDSYKAGDLAHVTVTLSNSGPIPLTGIVAACDRFGASWELTGRGPGWGELGGTGGVTIAPGETRTFDVTETVPEAAINRGLVEVACDFGYSEVDIEHHAQAVAKAAVPGAKAAVVGDVAYFPEGYGPGKPKQGIAGVKVVLVSDQACPVVGEQITDEKGHFEFHGLAPGPDYRLYALPPQGWRIKYDNPTPIQVFGPEDRPATVGMEAEPGDAPLPEVPANPATCTASATPTSTTGAAGGSGGGESGASGLASTGVDALGIGALALAALALGGGLLLGSRRRRRNA